MKWRGSATKSGYAVYQLVPSIRHKTGTDFGLWPTAMGVGARQAGQGDLNDPKRGEKLQTGLKAALCPAARQEDSQCAGAHKTNPDSVYSSLKTALWQTPNRENFASRRQVGATDRELLRAGQLKASLWPTAKAEMSGPDYARENREGSGGDDLATSLARGLTSPGSPCPPETVPLKFAALQLGFTSWLMGFSEEYLLNFVPNSSAPSETPSAGPSPQRSSAT
jgi:hypothetical protein